MIVQNDENALRLKCDEVLPNEVEELIKLLENELINSNTGGIGLAAPQIGIAKKIAIVRINEKIKVDLINCKIDKYYDEFTFENEGCLSFPDVKVNTRRYNEIHIINNLVYPHSFTATGLFSVCCQHELDHLNAILIKDKAIRNIMRQRPNEKCLCNSGKKYKKCCSLLKV
jgi:peptide deformylase